METALWVLAGVTTVQTVGTFIFWYVQHVAGTRFSERMIAEMDARAQRLREKDAADMIRKTAEIFGSFASYIGTPMMQGVAVPFAAKPEKLDPHKEAARIIEAIDAETRAGVKRPDVAAREQRTRDEALARQIVEGVKAAKSPAPDAGK